MKFTVSSKIWSIAYFRTLCSKQCSLRYVAQKKPSVWPISAPCFHRGICTWLIQAAFFVSMLSPVSVIESLCCVSNLTLGWTELLELEFCAWCWSLASLFESRNSGMKCRIRTTPPSDQGFAVSHKLWFNSAKKNENPDGERNKKPKKWLQQKRLFLAFKI